MAEEPNAALRRELRDARLRVDEARTALAQLLRDLDQAGADVIQLEAKARAAKTQLRRAREARERVRAAIEREHDIAQVPAVHAEIDSVSELLESAERDDTEVDGRLEARKRLADILPELGGIGREFAEFARVQRDYPAAFRSVQKLQAQQRARYFADVDQSQLENPRPPNGYDSGYAQGQPQGQALLPAQGEPNYYPLDYDLRPGDRGYYPEEAGGNPRRRRNWVLRGPLKRAWEYPMLMRRLFKNDRPMANLLAEAARTEPGVKEDEVWRWLLDMESADEDELEEAIKRQEHSLQEMDSCDLAVLLGLAEGQVRQLMREHRDHEYYHLVVFRLLQRFAKPYPGCK